MTAGRPHPTYRALWLALHSSGILATLGLELAVRLEAMAYAEIGLQVLHSASDIVQVRTVVWWLYFAAVLALELWTLYRKRLGLTADGTFSWTVWAYLPASSSRHQFGRLLLVVGWELHLLLGFGFRGWTPWPSLNFGLAMAFTLWSWPHFFGHQKEATT